MNKSLYDSYKKLTEPQRSDLNFKFKDSPVGLRLLHFLDTCKNRSFKNSDAVKAIYSDDSDTPYNVLENRYFKLRKKISDELQTAESIDPSNILTDEELRLYKCKNLQLNANKELAFRQLSELEAECWEKNIFELLPSIIDQLIFFNQSFNRLEKNVELHKRLELAIQLQYDMNRFAMLARQIYEINYKAGIKSAKKELNSLKEIASRNEKYPRFLMCYHHISLYYKLGSQEYIGEMQVVSRHLSEFKKLYALHPLMPLISYKLHYVKYQHFHFNQSTMFYHFNRCEFREAADCMKEVWNLVHSSNSIFGIYRTESLYNNMFTVQRLAGLYKEANITSDYFLDFMKENNQHDKLPLVYTQKARLYADVYPEKSLIKMDPGFLTAQVEEYIKKVRKEDNSQLPLEQALVLRMVLHIISGNLKKAKDMLKDEVIGRYLSSLNALESFRLLVQYMEDLTPASRELSELHKKAVAARQKAVSPAEYMHHKWISNYIEKIQKLR
jgi:hypothetical protein